MSELLIPEELKGQIRSRFSSIVTLIKTGQYHWEIQEPRLIDEHTENVMKLLVGWKSPKEVEEVKVRGLEAGAVNEKERITVGEHYVRRVDFTGEYLALAGRRRRKKYLATCVCGFRAIAFDKHLAEAKVLGHQETMQALKDKP